jgi:hypothetical protein
MRSEEAHRTIGCRDYIFAIDFGFGGGSRSMSRNREKAERKVRREKLFLVYVDKLRASRYQGRDKYSN